MLSFSSSVRIDQRSEPESISLTQKAELLRLDHYFGFVPLSLNFFTLNFRVCIDITQLCYRLMFFSKLFRSQHSFHFLVSVQKRNEICVINGNCLLICFNNGYTAFCSLSIVTKKSETQIFPQTKKKKNLTLSYIFIGRSIYCTCLIIVQDQ